MPHLQRALKLHLQFTQLQSNVLGLESALDAFDQVVFGLNREGRVVLSNQRAEDIVRRADGIKLSSGSLVATLPEENCQLQLHLSNAVASGTACGIAVGGSLLLRRKSIHLPLRVTITPFVSNCCGGYDQLAALTFISDPNAMPYPGPPPCGVSTNSPRQRVELQTCWPVAVKLARPESDWG
jgi:hypothetical protein